MTKGILISICLFIMTSLSAQNKQFTLEDLLPGGKTYSDFVPKTDRNYKWMGDELLSFDENTIYDSKGKALLTGEQLHTLTGEEISLKALSFISFQGRSLASLAIYGKKMLFFDLRTREIVLDIPLKSGWQNLDFNAENQSLAFTQENHLYITNAHSEPFLVAEDINPYIVYGQSVHRNEFGTYKGTFWSPQGNYLAFYRMDETMVGDYPLVDISAREAKLKNVKYPMAGMTSHEVTVGIYHLQSGKITYLKTGEPKDRYLTNISWDPNEQFIYIAELNREQNHLRYNQYNIENGEWVQTLFEERNERYVEPMTPALFLKKQPDCFLWQSQRDGYNHLYLYNTRGQLIRQLTQGNYPVTALLGLDQEEKFVFIQANEESPIEYQLYKVELKTGNKTQLTHEPGVHNGQLSASGKFLIDSYSSQFVPLNIDLITTARGKIERLQTAPDPYKDYLLPEITLGSLKAADGVTDLHYRMVKPTNFDPASQYPTVVYVYGGPHNQSVLNSWMGAVRGWDIYMAQQGYLIFTLDNRGSANRGFEFESIIHRHLGKHEMADQMKGVEYLLSLPYVDKDRMGVHGWSYGGFMTANLLLRHSDIFKVGVAGGPVIDWKYYEIMYGERYMDTPEENPEGYEATCINHLAGDLKGRFLLIHGDEDPAVVWQHSLSFLKACIAARTYPDYFVYPGHGHNIMGPDRIHLHEKITRYFNDYLK